MGDYLFLTGGTGLVGRYLMHDLLARGQKLAVLVRSSKRETGAERIEAILDYWSERTGRDAPKPVVLEGDILREDLGLNQADLNWVSRNCKTMMHSAASLLFHADGSGEPRLSNVVGTQNMLQVCEKAKLRELHYVSTAYVCGLRPGPIMESELNCGQEFRNDYEASKLEAEELVRSCSLFDKLTVYRPAVISGDSETGYTNTYHGIYLYLRLMALLVPRQPVDANGKRQTRLRLPMTGQERRNVIPVDWVSRVMTELYMNRDAHGNTFHLAPEECLTPKLIIDAGYKYFGSTGIEYIGYQDIDPATYNSFEAELLPAMMMYSNYAATDPTFDCTNTKRFAPDCPCPVIDEQMLHRYIQFGEEDRWGKRRQMKTRKKTFEQTVASGVRE
ncbi:MAG: SDR family oxidoreductase [Pirellula sp.]|jgi:thioester reductase-like protein